MFRGIKNWFLDFKEGIIIHHVFGFHPLIKYYRNGVLKGLTTGGRKKKPTQSCFEFIYCSSLIWHPHLTCGSSSFFTLPAVFPNPSKPLCSRRDSKANVPSFPYCSLNFARSPFVTLRVQNADDSETGGTIKSSQPVEVNILSSSSQIPMEYLYVLAETAKELKSLGIFWGSRRTAVAVPHPATRGWAFCCWFWNVCEGVAIRSALMNRPPRDCPPRFKAEPHGARDDIKVCFVFSVHLLRLSHQRHQPTQHSG